MYEIRLRICLTSKGPTIIEISLPTTPRQDEEEIKYLIAYDQVLVRIAVVFDT
jgi:hypothetical protein